MLESLTAAGVQCTYVLLTQLSAILPRASLVLLGASALHSDGALFARSGTAVVSMLAKEHKVPVVACVETYKFGERVVLDGVASNELGDPDVLRDLPANKALGIKKPSPPALTPLSLMYDLTPPSLITAVCTEVSVVSPVVSPSRADQLRSGSSPQAPCRLFLARRAEWHNQVLSEVYRCRHHQQVRCASCIHPSYMDISYTFNAPRPTLLNAQKEQLEPIPSKVLKLHWVY